MCVKVIASQRWDVFSDTVYINELYTAIAVTISQYMYILQLGFKINCHDLHVLWSHWILGLQVIEPENILLLYSLQLKTWF